MLQDALNSNNENIIFIPAFKTERGNAMKTLIGKASFHEIYKFLKKKDDNDILACFHRVFDAALLFFPSLMTKDATLSTTLGFRTDLLSAKNVVGSLGTAVVEFFNGRKYEKYLEKYEEMQVANFLIIYAAYFDTMRELLPDMNGAIQLKNNERLILSKKAIEKYQARLGERTENDKSATVLFQELEFPRITEAQDDYMNRLALFYELLNTEFEKFYQTMVEFETISGPQRDYIFAVIRTLPLLACDNYKKYQFTLMKEFPAFQVWVEREQFFAVQEKLEQINVGFHHLPEIIETYMEHCTDSRILRCFGQYSQLYRGAVAASCLRKDELSYNNGLLLPRMEDCFIPQKYKAINYISGLALDDEGIWSKQASQDNVELFIVNVLEHPDSLHRPVLILGHPGAGKSTLCNVLAANVLSREYHVIIVRLRDANADDTIAKQIEHQIERDLQLTLSWGDIVMASTDKPLLIIFDGYDELLQARGKVYANYIQQIAEFQESQCIARDKIVRCLVTSRFTLIGKASIPENSTVIRLCDFDDVQIKRWCKIWNDHNILYFRQNDLNPFTLDEKSNAYGLAKQPLLLLMLALYDASGNVLMQQSDLSLTELYENLIRDFIFREKKRMGPLKIWRWKSREIRWRNKCG